MNYKALHIILLICLSIGFINNSSGQILPNYGSQRAGLSSMSFLKNDLNPRSLALSGASVALNEDGFSLINNPALAAKFSSFKASASNMIIGAGAQQSFVSAIMPVGNSTFGLSINNLNSGAMEVRTEFQPNGTGELFYVNNLALGLTFAKNLSDMFAMGLTIKYLNEQIAQYTAHSASADLAFTYKTDFKDLTFAVMIQNFGGNSSLNGNFLEVDFNRDTSSIEVNNYTIPTLFKMGLSMVPLKTDIHAIRVLAELNHPNDNSENFRIGVEYGYQELVFVRTGYKFSVLGQSLPTFGLGFNTSVGAHPLKIHYALNPTNFFGNQHGFGLSFQWNKMERE